MAFPKFIRVRDIELTEKTGAPFDLSIVESSFNPAEGVYQLLEDEPATHPDGTPLPPSRGEKATGDDTPDYAAAVKADLEAEISRRNAQRGEDTQIVPAGTKKDDLVAALQADDAS